MIVAGIDPKRALTRLADPVAIGPSLLWRAGNIRTPGTVTKVNLVLSGTPRFTAAGSDEPLIHGRILIAPGIDPLERAHDAAKYGRWSDPPVMEATIPSLVDPSLVEGAPAGTQVMSVIAQSTPYALRDGSWDERREAFGDLVVSTLDAYAPGVAAMVTARQVLTPAGPGAGLRPDRRASAPRRARPGPMVPVATAARPRALPAGPRRPVPRRRRRASRWRRDRAERAERRSRDPFRLEEAPPLSRDASTGYIAAAGRAANAGGHRADPAGQGLAERASPGRGMRRLRTLWYRHPSRMMRRPDRGTSGRASQSTRWH